MRSEFVYVLFTSDSFARLWKFNNNIVMIKFMHFLQIMIRCGFPVTVHDRTNFWIIQFSLDSTNTKIISVLLAFNCSHKIRLNTAHLIAALRTAIENGGVLDNDTTSFDDCFDSLGFVLALEEVR